jgi:hypothetical protein
MILIIDTRLQILLSSGSVRESIEKATPTMLERGEIEAGDLKQKIKKPPNCNNYANDVYL